MALLNIPDHLLVLLLEFVNIEDTTSFVCCCKELYHFRYFRRQFLSFLGSCRGWEEKVKMVHDPFNRLNLSIHTLPNNELIQFLHKVNRFNALRCNETHFILLMRELNQLTVKELDLHAYKLVESTRVPNLLSLKRLRLKNVNFLSNMTLLVDYSSRLQYLSLHNCTISDVSMLGSIPHLELSDCNNIVDISSLNNNNQIVISICLKVFDFSHSCANSRKIVIRLPYSPRENSYSFDLTRWKKVEDLALSLPSSRGARVNTVHYNHGNQLPRTVKRCALEGDIEIDFSLTPDHALHEFKLSTNYSLTSLEGFGLERIAIIECVGVRFLQSLRGLGSGRNQKITIRDCPEIYDFSPLNHLPIVEISNCEGFRDPLQVSSVRDLTITATRPLRFHWDRAQPNPYENIFCLTIPNTGCLTTFEGLQKIPYLQLDCNGFYFLKWFLSRGGQLENHRIVLASWKTDCSHEEILDLHEQYMEGYYVYYDRLPMKWIWLRKN